MKNSIPDRWLNYKPIGTRINGTQFIAFKVPLKQALNNKVEADERFSPESLLSICKDVSLVIDLTNTLRYYNRNEFTDKGVKHEKIFSPGHEVPAVHIVKRFFNVVDSFLENSNPDDLIGVHCTHGVNRTGYLICRYMIQRLGIKPQDAIEDFAKARGHPIERKNYIDHLNCELQEIPRGEIEKHEESNDRSDQRFIRKRRGDNDDLIGVRNIKRRRWEESISSHETNWRNSNNIFESCHNDINKHGNMNQLMARVIMNERTKFSNDYSKSSTSGSSAVTTDINQQSSSFTSDNFYEDRVGGNIQFQNHQRIQPLNSRFAEDHSVTSPISPIHLDQQIDRFNSYYEQRNRNYGHETRHNRFSGDRRNYRTDNRFPYERSFRDRSQHYNRYHVNNNRNQRFDNRTSDNRTHSSNNDQR